MERFINEIDGEIASLEAQLLTVKGTDTEVYTRIVGYHRALSNWNKGKREEYNHRVCFDADKWLSNEIVDKHSSNIVMRNETDFSFSTYGNVSKYVFFYGEYCRNCKPVKDYIDEIAIEGEKVDVGSDLGLNIARQYNVTTTPTVIMLDTNNQVIAKLHSKEELISFTNKFDEAIA